VGTGRKKKRRGKKIRPRRRSVQWAVLTGRVQKEVDIEQKRNQKKKKNQKGVCRKGDFEKKTQRRAEHQISGGTIKGLVAKGYRPFQEVVASQRRKKGVAKKRTESWEKACAARKQFFAKSKEDKKWGAWGRTGK